MNPLYWIIVVALIPVKILACYCCFFSEIKRRERIEELKKLRTTVQSVGERRGQFAYGQFQNSEPSAQGDQPSVQNGQPHVQNGQPHVQNSQPLVLNGQPHVLNGQVPVQNGQAYVQNGQIFVVQGQSFVPIGQAYGMSGPVPPSYGYDQQQPADPAKPAAVPPPVNGPHTIYDTPYGQSSNV